MVRTRRAIAALAGAGVACAMLLVYVHIENNKRSEGDGRWAANVSLDEVRTHIGIKIPADRS